MAEGSATSTASKSMTTQILINEQEFTLKLPERPAVRFLWDDKRHEWMPCITQEQYDKA